MATEKVEQGARPHNLAMDVARKEIARCRGRRLHTKGIVYTVTMEIVADQPFGGRNGSIATLRNWLSNWAAGLGHQGRLIRVRKLDCTELVNSDSAQSVRVMKRPEGWSAS